MLWVGAQVLLCRLGARPQGCAGQQRTHVCEPVWGILTVAIRKILAPSCGCGDCAEWAPVQGYCSRPQLVGG